MGGADVKRYWIYAGQMHTSNLLRSLVDGRFLAVQFDSELLGCDMVVIHIGNKIAYRLTSRRL
jgi:hypothetical protein